MANQVRTNITILSNLESFKDKFLSSKVDGDKTDYYISFPKFFPRSEDTEHRFKDKNMFLYDLCCWSLSKELLEENGIDVDYQDNIYVKDTHSASYEWPESIGIDYISDVLSSVFLFMRSETSDNDSPILKELISRYNVCYQDTQDGARRSDLTYDLDVFISNCNKHKDKEWYDWSVDSWGTSCDASGSCLEGNVLTFDTEWVHPHTVIERMMMLSPSIILEVEYREDDPTSTNYGLYRVENGEITNLNTDEM